MRGYLVLLLITLVCSVSGAGALPFPWLVDLSADLLDDTRVQLSTVVGLINIDGPRVAAISSSKELLKWQPFLEQRDGKFIVVQRRDFFAQAVATSPHRISRKIVYAWSERKLVLPTVLTLCGIHGAVAVAAEFDNRPNLKLVMNITKGTWKSYEDATRFILEARERGDLPEAFVKNPLMMIQDPAARLAQGFNVDLIVSRGLWAFWFDGLCETTTQNKTRPPGQYNALGTAMLRNITEGPKSPKAAGSRFITLLGYYGTPTEKVEVPGHCTATHTQITLASDLASSLSYFSQQRLVSELKQIAINKMVFDSNKTYVAFVTSDGDNLAYDYGGTHDMMAARVQQCTHAHGTADGRSQCPPISWTLSPRLVEFAPALLEWYYKQAHITQRDSFLFGPSGYGYLYPSQLSPHDRTEFVKRTIAVAKLYDASAFVESENGVWNRYEERKEFAAAFTGSQVTGVFTGNWVGQHVINDDVAILEGAHGYAPYESIPLNASKLIADLNGLPRGTVGQLTVIVTPPQIPALIQVAQGVQEHVELVGHRELVHLQKQKYASLPILYA